jgi:tRNA (guanine-N(7)-)-methyltransferase
MFLDSFVKRRRPLSKAKKLLLEEVLPKFIVTPDSLYSLIKKYDKINLEIGFGKGEFLEAISNREQENNSLNIGCEVYTEGVASILQKIKDHDIRNLAIWPDDARILIEKFPNHSIDVIYILFPDPWPKQKQQKRRIINPEFIKLLSDKLKTNGKIFFASDHHGYADWTLKYFKQSQRFHCEDISKDSAELFENCVTKYHKKNLEGADIKLLKFSL